MDQQTLIYSDSPPAKVFFQVLVDYALDHESRASIEEEDRFLESDFLPSFKAAYTVAESLAEEIKLKFDTARVEILPREDVDDEYMFYVVDPDDDEIARIGIRVCDYRGTSFH